MAGAAKPRTRIGKRIKDEGGKSKELYSLHRRSDTPTQIAPSFTAGSSAGPQAGDVNFLPTGGGTMVGALAFFPKLITISTGAIDISKTTDDYTSRVIVTPETGSTDDLTTITGAANAGQLLFLQGVQADTITIKNSGNIETIDGGDFLLEDDDILIFQFDTTDNKWQQVTTGKQGVASLSTGTHISASLSADQTTNISATNHIEFDTVDEGDIVLQTGAGQADGIFELKQDKTYVIKGQLRPEFSGATGSLVVAWYDITNAAELGKRGIYEPTTQTADDANQPIPEIIVKPATDITVELRIISVTALTALANEYCIATMFEFGGSGAGAVSFPITPTINDHGNVGTVTEDIDLSLSTGHVHKIILTGNPTLTFSNPPASGIQIEFEIEFVQDGTGGRTVTYPATVVEAVSIALTAGTTTIVTFRTNDGGTFYHAIPALRGSISLVGNSANKTLSNLGTTSINDGLFPDGDGVHDLGATTLAWKEIWVDNIRNAATTSVSSPNFAINSSQITLGDAITDEVSFLGRVGSLGIIPIANSTTNLGASGKQWNTLWIDTLTNATTVVISSPNFAMNSSQITLGDSTSDDISFLGQVDREIVMEEISDPGAADANTGRYYARVSGGVSVPFWQDEAGTETNMIDTGVSLSDNNTWTGIQTFTGTTFNVNCTAINLGDAGTDQVNILANKVLPALDATTQLGETSLAWEEVWVDTIRNDGTTAIASPTFSINSATINIGDAGTDVVNLLANTYTPATDEAVIFGATTKELKEVWVSTLRNSASITISPVSSTSIISPTINLGDAITDTINFLGRPGTDLKFNFGETIDYNANQSSVGSSGFASSLPTNPTGYVIVKIAGTERVIPFYDKI